MHKPLKTLVYVIVLIAGLIYIVNGLSSIVVSKYHRQGSLDIMVEAAPGSGPENDIKNLPSSLECVPGADASDYYTRSLTPGGICKGQDFVVASANYKITGGIGEPLLSDARVSANDDNLYDF